MMLVYGGRSAKSIFVRFVKICEISARRALYIDMLNTNFPVRSRFARRFSSTAEGKVKSFKSLQIEQIFLQQLHFVNDAGIRVTVIPF